MPVAHFGDSRATSPRAMSVTARTLRTLLAASLTALSAACGGGGSDGPVQPPPVCTVSAVSITPASASVFLGATAQLLATPTSQNCSPVPTATWSSSAPGVASVSSTGLVTALTSGTATITVTVGAASGTSNITVSPAPVGSLTMTPATATLVTGGTTNLTVVARDAANNVLTGRVVTFVSSAPAVASVAAGGVVTALTPGTATITATSEGVSATATITVIVPPVASVSVTAPANAVSVGLTLQATAVTKDASNAVLTGRPVIWSTSSPSVATVNSNGLITGVAPGPVTITATSEGQSGTVQLTVQLPVASITLAPISAQMVPTATTTPTITMRAANNDLLTGRTVVWSSSVPSVATVNASSGLITAVAVGTSVITATSEGVSATMNVKVVPTTESQRYASIWADQAAATLNTPYTPDPNYSVNAAGGANSVMRIGVGTYNVTFGKMAKVSVAAFRETFLVTAYGSSGEYCRIGSWDDSNVTDMLVRVLCYDLDGLPVNTRFDLAMIGSGTLTGQYGFVWNPNAGTSAGTLGSTYAFNTAGGAMSVTRNATGLYATTMGFTTANKTAALTSSYAENAACAVDFWSIATGTVTTRCSALNSSTATDSRSTVLLMEGGRAGKRWGFVWADDATSALGTPYSPNTNYRNQSNGQNTTVTRNGTGLYGVTLTGLGATTFGGTILVSAYLSNTGVVDVTCQVLGWNSNGTDVVVGVKCWNLNTKLAVDTRFVLAAIE